MLNTIVSKEDILSELRSVTDANATSEQLFNLMFELFVTSKDAPIGNLEMCEDVLTHLVAYVEVEARKRISERLSQLEHAPRRVVRCLALESIEIAKPVLKQSPVLEDEDLLMVTRVCGPQHLEAIAQRPAISSFVTNELMRLGGVQVWEHIASNNGAELEEKTVGFLVNRAKENSRIQICLINREDLPDATIAKLVSEAGEVVREHLITMGKEDLVTHLEQVEMTTTKRLSKRSRLVGMDFEKAYERVVQEQQQVRLNWRHLMDAAAKNDFPRTCAVFACLSKMELDEVIHWLSRPEVEPAIVACKALKFDREVVATLLRTGPWERFLSAKTRMDALKMFDRLNPYLAERNFAGRHGANVQQLSIA